MKKRIFVLSIFTACSVSMLASCVINNNDKRDFKFNGSYCHAIYNNEDITSKKLSLDSGTVFTCKVVVDDGFELSKDNIVVLVKNEPFTNFTYENNEFSMKIEGDALVTASAKQSGVPQRPTKDITDPDTSCKKEEISENTFLNFYKTITSIPDPTSDENYQKMLKASKEADDIFKVTNSSVSNLATYIKPLIDWGKNPGKTYEDRKTFRLIVRQSGLMNFLLSLGDDAASELLSYFFYCCKPFTIMRGNSYSGSIDCVPYGQEEKARMLNEFSSQSDITTYLSNSDVIYENNSSNYVKQDPINFLDKLERKDFMCISRYVYRLLYCLNFYSGDELQNMLYDGIFFMRVSSAAPTKEQWKKDFDFTTIFNQFGNWGLQLDSFISDNGLEALIKYGIDYGEFQTTFSQTVNQYYGNVTNLSQSRETFKKCKSFLNNTSPLQLRSVFRFIAYLCKSIDQNYEIIAKNYFFSDDLSKGLGAFLKASIPIYDQAFGNLGQDQTNLIMLFNRLSLGQTFEQFITKMKEFANFEKPDEHQKEISQYFENIFNNLKVQFFYDCSYNVSIITSSSQSPGPDYRYVLKGKTLSLSDYKNSLKVTNKQDSSKIISNFTVDRILKNLDTSKIGTFNAEIEITVEGKETFIIAPTYKVVEPTIYLGSSSSGTECNNTSLNLYSSYPSNPINLVGLNSGEAEYDYGKHTYFVPNNLSKTLNEFTTSSNYGAAYKVNYNNDGSGFIQVSETKLIDANNIATVKCSAVSLNSLGYHYRSVKIGASDGNTYFTFIRYYVYDSSKTTIKYDLKDSYNIINGSDLVTISTNRITTIYDGNGLIVTKFYKTVYSNFKPTGSSITHVTFDDQYQTDISLSYHDMTDSKVDAYRDYVSSSSILNQRVYKKGDVFNLVGMYVELTYDNDYSCHNYTWCPNNGQLIKIDSSSLLNFDTTTSGASKNFSLGYKISKSSTQYFTIPIYYNVGYSSTDSSYITTMASVLSVFPNLDKTSTEVNPCSQYCWRASFVDQASAIAYMKNRFNDFDSKKETILNTIQYKYEISSSSYHYLRIYNNVLECC